MKAGEHKHQEICCGLLCAAIIGIILSGCAAHTHKMQADNAMPKHTTFDARLTGFFIDERIQ